VQPQLRYQILHRLHTYIYIGFDITDKQTLLCRFANCLCHDFELNIWIAQKLSKMFAFQTTLQFFLQNFFTNFFYKIFLQNFFIKLFTIQFFSKRRGRITPC
jgi:hypothetical protein